MFPSNLENGRRHAVRFKLGRDLFAVLKQGKSILGTIIDISHAGFSFSHLAQTDAEAGSLFQVDFFLSGDGFLSKSIACKKISDVIELKATPFSSVSMRRLRAQFIDLTTEQRAQLKFIISHLTNGRLHDRRCRIERRSGNRRCNPFQQNRVAFERRFSDDRRKARGRRYMDSNDPTRVVH